MATLDVVVDADGASRGARQFERAVGDLDASGGRATRTVDRLDRSLRDLARISFRGIALGTAALTAFTVSSVRLSSSIDEVQSKFDVVFGTEAERVRRSLADIGDRTNRSALRMEEFAASLQDTFVPMGLARDLAADLSVGLLELGQDVGSFQDIATPDVLRDFQSALVGNSETVRKYGIVITEARVQQEAFRLGLVEQGEELSNQDKLLARLSLLYEDTTDAQGDAERTADSFANSVRGLTDEIFDLRAEAGRELQQALTDTVAELGGADEVVRLLAEGFDLATRASTALIGVIPDVVEFVGGVARFGREASIAVGDLVEELDRFTGAADQLSRLNPGNIFRALGLGADILEARRNAAEAQELLNRLRADRPAVEPPPELGTGPVLGPVSAEGAALTETAVASAQALSLALLGLGQASSDAVEETSGAAARFREVLGQFRAQRDAPGGEGDGTRGAERRRDLTEEAIDLQRELNRELGGFEARRVEIDAVADSQLRFVETLEAENVIAPQVLRFAQQRIEALREQRQATLEAAEAQARFHEEFRQGAEQAQDNPFVSGAAQTAFFGLTDGIGQAAAEARNFDDFVDSLGQTASQVFQQIIADTVTLALRLAIVNTVGNAFFGGSQAAAAGFFGFSGPAIGGQRGGFPDQFGRPGATDTVVARLDPREFVVPADAAARLGTAQLEAIRAGQTAGGSSQVTNVRQVVIQPGSRDTFGESERQRNRRLANLANRVAG